jgi:DNA primase
MDPYQAAKEEIKSSADIAELIGQYVQLKKTGQNHVGLCPFHGDKDPSFSVSRSKQMFHCFGCKKSGDIFTFWMEYHKVSFPQAMKDLADKYGVILPEKELTTTQKRKLELKEIIYKINETAVKYYNHILEETDKGRPGNEYFQKRSINKNIIREYKLGYALSEWDGLTRFLEREKVHLDKAVKAGLIIHKKSGGYYDRFRGRVIFPIFDIKNQVVGFGGRVLDSSLPKYLNTPETVVFRKGELLYGLNRAYQHIRESGRVVIVEGYTDVLALRNHGFKEAVATLGTALTQDHIRKLRGYAKEAIVVFDSDTAGIAAAIKSLSLFLNEGLTSKVMVLPEGDDPDTFINKNGLEDFLKLLQKSAPMFEFYLDVKMSEIEEGVEGQVDFLNEAIPVLSEITSDLQRAVYIKSISEKIGISEVIILNELRRTRRSGKKGDESWNLRDKISNTKAKSLNDIQVLNLLINFPEAFEKLLNNDWRLILSDPAVIQIIEKTEEIYRSKKSISPSEILEKLEDQREKAIFSEIMLSESIYTDDTVDQAIMDYENRIKSIKISKSISEAKEQGDIEKLNKLIKLKKAG